LGPRSTTLPWRQINRKAATDFSFAVHERPFDQVSNQDIIVASHPSQLDVPLVEAGEHSCDVLIIDDEHDVRQFLQHSLQSKYRSSSCGDGNIGR
jgi:hypothetical protein